MQRLAGVRAYRARVRAPEAFKLLVVGIRHHERERVFYALLHFQRRCHDLLRRIVHKRNARLGVLLRPHEKPRAARPNLGGRHPLSVLDMVLPDRQRAREPCGKVLKRHEVNEAHRALK